VSQSRSAMTDIPPKNTRERRRWGPIAVIAGVTYFTIGVVFGALAGSSGSTLGLKAWRWAAFALSLVVFLVHVRFDYQRFRNALTTARHVAIGVALGGFLLAAMATARATLVEGTPRRLLVALVAWPLLTGVPAFVAAWILATMLGRLRQDQPV